mgnify:CR=1 FL=1
MDILVALGITIGVLAGIWGVVAGNLALLTWAGFVSWACYFASGGKVDGLKRTIAANLAGVIWGVLMVVGAGALNFPYAIGVTIAIGAFFMCVEAKINILSFIPGAFCGCAVYFGSGLKWEAAAIALIIGAVLGYLSDIAAIPLTKMGKKEDEKVEASN